MLKKILGSVSKKSTAAPLLKKVQKMPDLDELLVKQDYEASITLLNHKVKSGNLDAEETQSLFLWLGFCYFRLKCYDDAAEIYMRLMKQDDAAPEIGVYLAVCKFHEKKYLEAKAVAEKCPKSPLFNRLMMNVALRLNDEKRILAFHSNLGTGIEDTLSLAAVNYCRMHYQEAINVYTETLSASPTLLGLNVYMALCYHKLDFEHVAYRLIKNYLNHFPDSPFAINLLLAIVYRTVSAKTTVDEDSDLARNLDEELRTALPRLETVMRKKLYPEVEGLLRHNQVLYNDCQAALQVLPSLIKTVPEARLNLILYHLGKNELNDAMNLCHDFEPTTPYEFLVNALALIRWGQANNGKDQIRQAENYFRMVGESTLVENTVAGRQSNAAHHFLAGKFEEVKDYLSSISEFMPPTDDSYTLNLAQSLLMTKQYREAEEEFIKVSGPERDKPLYKGMLARCYIRSKHPQKAWDIMQKTKNLSDKQLLTRLIANDCYIANEFYFATKAFHEIEKFDPSLDNWNGKRGACAGLFRHLANNKNDQNLQMQMREVLQLIQANHHPNSEFLLKVIFSWGKSHNVNLTFSSDNK